MKFGSTEFNQRLLKMLASDGYRHDCYKQCVEHAEEMSWHFYGTTPDELLNRSRPREDPEVTAYRKANYEPTTKSAADKTLNITAKIFNPNLSSIRWKKQSKTADQLKEYTLVKYPKYNSIVSFMKDVLLRKMIADPNGVAVVKLIKVPVLGTETPEPQIILYGSENVWDYDDEHWLINTGVEEVKNINVYAFEYYDDTEYISFNAYKDSQGNLVIEENPEDSYVHGFNEIPIWQLIGMVECIENGETMYKSFYSSAAPYWNLHIIHESDLFGAYITHLHPQKWEITETCNYRFTQDGVDYRCNGGNIKTPNGIIPCEHCEGSGRVSVKSPYGVYKLNKEKLDENPSSSVAPVEYINIPTEATKMLEARVDNMLRQGMWAINMDIEDNVGENQSGIAKVIDRSAQYDTLFNIGSVVYDIHMQNAFYFINKYMFSVSANSIGLSSEALNDNLPEINKPTQFDITTTAELVANYQVANQSGLDSSYLILKTQEIISRDLTTNPDLKEFTLLLLNLDPLAGISQQIIAANVSKGFNSKQDAVIHFNIKSFVERAIRENNGFATFTKDKQIEILTRYADEFINKNKPVLDTTFLNQPLNGQGSLQKTTA